MKWTIGTGFAGQEIEQLKKENNRLAQHIVELQKDKGDLIDKVKSLKAENAELKQKNEQLLDMAANSVTVHSFAIVREAKELIRNIIRVTWGEGWNYSLDVKAKAEQLLKEPQNG